MAGAGASFADSDCAEMGAAAASAQTTIAYAAAMRLKIKRLDSTVPLPTYATEEAAGFDLAASQDVRLAPGQIALVPTGLVIEVPSGHFLAIFARSSTPLKRGLMVANGVGVLDPDYCGPDDEVKIQVLNVSGAEVQVKRGDRLAQGIVLPAPRVSWQEVRNLREVTRGGFGATGN
jgi:dUTP diphosphatase